jgi:ABC-type transporter MlaC component
MKRRSLESPTVSTAFAAWLLVGAAMLPAAADSPLAVIKSSNGRVQEILARHDKIDPATEAELFRTIDAVTDFDAISRRAIEPFAQKWTRPRAEEFAAVFQRLLRVSSIKKLGRYRADRFDYLGESVTGDSALVRTLAYYKDDQVNLDYQLELAAGKWRIVNYVVDDVDTIRNYRKQFVRLFAKNSYDQVLDRLRRKIAEYEKEY